MKWNEGSTSRFEAFDETRPAVAENKMSPVEKKVSTTAPPFLVPSDSVDSGSDSEYDSDADEIPDPWCEPEKPRIVGFEDITAASFRIRNGIIRTPCDVSWAFFN